MIFSRSNNIELPEPLIVSETLIEHKHEARFLGVIVDESLSWTCHVKAVQSKMSRYVGIMYKIKKFLPLNARQQIYHSFFQSYVNYCSLVWGFTAKSNIDSLFAKQKKALRAVIPGFINYKYKNGKLPGHTKSKFSDYKILTIHNIIAQNAFILLHKIQNYPSLIPQSIRDTIPDNSPVVGSTHQDCENWLKVYDNQYYRKSVFFKGPILLSGTTLNSNLPLTSFLTIKFYKRNVKEALLKLQSSGDTCDWQSNNFVLYNYLGLRRSQTSYRQQINYNIND